MIMGSRNKRGATLTAIDNNQAQPEASEIDGSRQPGRSRADNQAIGDKLSQSSVP
jgi:hypothetical protein